MSYHAKKSAGQRSTGLIVVVVLHIILIYGLATALDRDTIKKAVEILKADVKEEEKPKEDLPPPPPPEVKPPPPDFVPPPQLDFVPDAPPATTQIQNVQRVEPKAVTPPTQTKAKPAGKGLSQPEYPTSSKRLGEEGLTTLQILIGEDGKVSDAKVAVSSGHDKLDEAAVKHALRSWKFIPCMQGDKPVACWQTVPLRWRLVDEK